MSRNLSKSTREQVRKRANGRCEYCRKPEGYSLYSHHVDHIRPLKHGGGNELDNLAWSCFRCNVSKGSNISSYDPYTGQLTPLYNPRTQRWSNHFVLHDAHIRGRTAGGRVTVAVLNMNHPTQVETRRLLIEQGKF